VVLEHFTRHLRVARLVSPNQAELSQPVHKQERTEARQQQRVSARAIRHGRTEGFKVIAGKGTSDELTSKL
jgi:hypothetical protein